ncbi:MAG TPA: HEAT repeat domain-containing protein [Urbifossiella sp.]|nr:HEAT repeat domain-containing protein [Urbifossiella sp.]
MADLGLRLRVFIASSAELLPEREEAEAQVAKLAVEAARSNLFLEPFRWEKHSGAFHDRYQLTLNEFLRPAEHVVVLLWTKYGDGTREEFDRALAQARRGETDNVSVYIKTGPKGEVSPGLDGCIGNIRRGELALTKKFHTTPEFATQFEHDLRLWITKWAGVARCCAYALQNSRPVPPFTPGPDRLAAMRGNPSLRHLDGAEVYLGRAAVGAYQGMTSGGDLADAVTRPLSVPDLSRLAPDWKNAAAPGDPWPVGVWPSQRSFHPTPLRRDPGGSVCVADTEWFWYFVSLGLAHAIQAGNWHAAAGRPYCNDVHQYLAGWNATGRFVLVPNLQHWLAGRTPAGELVQPVARNFAAYELGMLGDYESQPLLYEAFCNDPSDDVRTYCLTSLGKLRARRYLSQLVEAQGLATDPGRKLLISQVICTMVGAAPFPL